MLRQIRQRCLALTIGKHKHGVRMKIKFYGTRGSIPVCDRDFLKFGDNTTSIKITRDNGRISIIDAGTGILNIGIDLIKDNFYQDELFIGFSHFHWDHIQGFPFFEPRIRSQYGH